jgi:hypothetical protein
MGPAFVFVQVFLGDVVARLHVVRMQAPRAGLAMAQP